MTYASTVAADSPIAHFRLGEPSGTTCSPVSGTAVGTYQNTPTLGVTGLIAGDADTSVTFASASDEYVSIATMPAGSTSGATIEAWVKPGTLTTDDFSVVGKWGAQGVEHHLLRYYEAGASSFWRWGAYDGTARDVNITHQLTSGTTYHVVGVHDYSAETFKLYINGSQQGTTQDLSAWSAMSAIAYEAVSSIAAFQSGTQLWNGTIDEVAFYSTALSSTRVAAHYAAGTASGPTWTTPADTVSMSTTPELKFNSPASAAKQHFYLQLDTANTFDTGNLRTYNSSTTQTNWDYWDGAAWTAMPSDGLPIAKSGNEIRYTVTSALSSATWYRRVRAGTLV